MARGCRGGRAGAVTPCRILVARDLAVAPAGAAKPVLEQIGLELEPGGWLALAGPNGCGKSTLALTLAGLLPARSGQLVFEGQPLGPGVPPERRRAISAVLQDPSNPLLQP